MIIGRCMRQVQSTALKKIDLGYNEIAEDGAFRDAAAFFSSGTSNKWEGILPAEDMAAYHSRISGFLTPGEIAWLEWGDRRSP